MSHLGVPLVALVSLGPIVLVVPLRAPALAPEALAGVSLEHHQLAQGTGAPTPYLVAVSGNGLLPARQRLPTVGQSTTVHASVDETPVKGTSFMKNRLENFLFST